MAAAELKPSYLHMLRGASKEVKERAFQLEDKSDRSNSRVVPSPDLRCSVLSARVVWLDTDERYIVTEDDPSCVNGKCIKFNDVCWVEMGHYQFPPPDSPKDGIPAGSYVLVQRIKTVDPTFQCSLNFELTYENESKDSKVSTHVQSDSQKINDTDYPKKLQLPFGGVMPLTLTASDDWHLVAVGIIDLPEPCTLKMRAIGNEGRSWKRGFYLDYFELMKIECQPRKLQDQCVIKIADHLVEESLLALMSKYEAAWAPKLSGGDDGPLLKSPNEVERFAVSAESVDLMASELRIPKTLAKLVANRFHIYVTTGHGRGRRDAKSESAKCAIL